MTKEFKQLSKTMSHALRHKPAQYGLSLDTNGWIAIPTLIEGLRGASRRYANVDRTMIEAMMADSEKKRFEIEDDRIRAVYGHSSSDIEMSYTASEPPETLYHGTTPQALEIIRTEGLKSMNRKFVHLSPEIETALVVAKRRTGKPQIIKVQALRAFQDGVGFYCGHDAVWLSDKIAPEYLVFQ